jgi:hypothetical protein
MERGVYLVAESSHAGIPSQHLLGRPMIPIPDHQQHLPSIPIPLYFTDALVTGSMDDKTAIKAVSALYL